MWYMSTLFQFYLFFLPLCWLKGKTGNRNRFCLGCFLISIIWWIFTTWAGITGIRIWGSFFLQYLWEFALGMTIADYLSEGNKIEIRISVLWKAALIGLLLAAIAVLKGGVLRTFNDIPALIGYGSTLILLYLFSNYWINKSILFLSKISFELYLVHILVFECVFRMFNFDNGGKIYFLAIMAFGVSIIVAVLYKRILNVFWKRINA